MNCDRGSSYFELACSVSTISSAVSTIRDSYIDQPESLGHLYTHVFEFFSAAFSQLLPIRDGSATRDRI